MDGEKERKGGSWWDLNNMGRRRIFLFIRGLLLSPHCSQIINLLFSCIVAYCSSIIVNKEFSTIIIYNSGYITFQSVSVLIVSISEVCQ